MGKTKPIKATEIASTPKHKPIILANYRPMPRFNGGCSRC